MKKAEIVVEINDIIKKNNKIKAVDTNKILRDILDCDELNDLSLFHFFNPKPLEDGDNALLWYSIKIVKPAFVNVTLRIVIKVPGIGERPELKFKDEKIANVIDLLKAYNETNNFDLIDYYSKMDFLVKIKNTKMEGNEPFVKQKFKKKLRIANLNFSLLESSIVLKIESQELDDNLFAGDEIFTSFTLHCPRFTKD